MAGLNKLFDGRHFDREGVRWYPRLSSATPTLVQMMVERGLSLAHTTTHALGAPSCSRVRTTGTGSPGRLGPRGVSMRPTLPPAV
jgi:hypothetical protein